MEYDKYAQRWDSDLKRTGNIYYLFYQAWLRFCIVGCCVSVVFSKILQGLGGEKHARLRDSKFYKFGFAIDFAFGVLDDSSVNPENEFPYAFGSHILGEAETVPICLRVLQMQFLVQFQTKVFSHCTVFVVQSISDLRVEYELWKPQARIRFLTSTIFSANSLRRSS